MDLAPLLSYTVDGNYVSIFSHTVEDNSAPMFVCKSLQQLKLRVNQFHRGDEQWRTSFSCRWGHEHRDKRKVGVFHWNIRDTDGFDKGLNFHRYVLQERIRLTKYPKLDIRLLKWCRDGKYFKIFNCRGVLARVLGSPLDPDTSPTSNWRSSISLMGF